MKKILIAFTLLLFASFQLSAQIETPVTWTNSSKQVAPDTYEITFVAKIDPGWHVYSQHIKEGGPVPTSFNFEKPEGYKAEDKAIEKSEIHKSYDANFEMDMLYFNDKAVFVQTIKTSKPNVKVTGYLEYMVCNDTKCLPPTAVDFEIVLKK